MKIIKSLEEMQKYSCEMRMAGKKIAIVPTMGFLHEGHLSLIDEAHKHADIIIVSIFVNPTQFAPNEDLATYPRDMQKDCKLCELRKVNAIFAPENDDIYSNNASTWVTEDHLSQTLCGKSRPEHFRGVTTIVTKLFNITSPHIAVFGRKDYQQAAIITRMVRDLNFPIKIITCPIFREKDGLAMSSRNKYLSETERQNALSIQESLNQAIQMIQQKETSISSTTIIGQIKEMINMRISQSCGTVDYVEILDADTLETKNNLTGHILIAIAAFFGTTRLIDNVTINIPLP